MSNIGLKCFSDQGLSIALVRFNIFFIISNISEFTIKKIKKINIYPRGTIQIFRVWKTILPDLLSCRSLCTGFYNQLHFQNRTDFGQKLSHFLKVKVKEAQLCLEQNMQNSYNLRAVLPSKIKPLPHRF